MQKAGVIKEHFMTHKQVRNSILDSWKKHGFKLSIGMVKGNYLDYIEPINLIANYYGEKYAMCFAFLVHHMGWLWIPAIFGALLWLYHLYMGIFFQEEN